MTREEIAPGDFSLPAERPPHVRSLSWKCAQTFSQIICAVFFDLKVYGTQNIPPQGGALLVSNHQSYLDPILLAVKLKRSMSFLAKSELFENPALGWLIRRFNGFPVRQGKGDKGAIEEMIRRLKQGHLLGLFAEGTRTEDGNLGPIQRGAALVVRRAAVPILPVVIEGSFQSWPRGRKMFRPHPIGMLYGPPLDIEGLKGDAIVALIDSTFHRMLDELRQRVAHT